MHKQKPSGRIPLPNYTQVPNVLFEHMADMTCAELKVTLALVRKIVGFHKTQPEPVSISQLEALTGLSRPTVVRGLEAAAERGFVRAVGTGKRGVKLYTLWFADEAEPQPPSTTYNESLQVAQDEGTTSKLDLLELVNSVNTQKKSSKEKDVGATPPHNAPSSAYAAQEEDPSNAVPPADMGKKLIDEVVRECGFPVDGTAAKNTYPRAGRIVRLLLGKPVGRGDSAVKVPPDAVAKPSEFTQFARWWRSKFRDAPVPRDPVKLHEWWMTWRAEQAKARRAPNALDMAANSVWSALVGEGGTA